MIRPTSAAFAVNATLANPPICYDSVNPAVLARVPISAKRLLDIGCGAGGLGAAVKKRQNCTVTGVTHNAEEAARAAILLDDVVVADLNEFTPTMPGRLIASFAVTYWNIWSIRGNCSQNCDCGSIRMAFWL